MTLNLVGNEEPLRALEQGGHLLSSVFKCPGCGCGDLSTMRKGKGERSGGRDGRRGCPLELWEPVGGSQTQVLSSAARWGDGACVTAGGHPGSSPHS